MSVVPCHQALWSKVSISIHEMFADEKDDRESLFALQSFSSCISLFHQQAGSFLFVKSFSWSILMLKKSNAGITNMVAH